MDRLLDCSPLLEHLYPKEIARLACTSSAIRGLVESAFIPANLPMIATMSKAEAMDTLYLLSSEGLCKGNRKLLLNKLTIPRPTEIEPVDILLIVRVLDRIKEAREVVLAMWDSEWIFKRIIDGGYPLSDMGLAPSPEYVQACGNWADDDDDKFAETVNSTVRSFLQTLQESKPAFVVDWSDSMVNPTVAKMAREAIDAFTEASRVDYHPRSSGVVRDILHPSLFCLVSDKSTRSMKLPDPSNSPITPEIADAAAKNNSLNVTHNFFGRNPHWLESHYQWIPVDVKVGNDLQSCNIISPLNSIDWQANEESDVSKNLVVALEKLLAGHLPSLNRVWRGLTKMRQTLQAIEPASPEANYFLNYEDERLGDSSPTFYGESANPIPASLAGRTIQVVPKIAEYTFDPSDEKKQSFEGVFHIEGMPSENIVATAVHVLDRDGLVEGGEIQMKRQMKRNEFENGYELGQDAFSEVARELFEKAQEQYIPLGTLPTPEGRSFVFPNYVVHKVKKMGLLTPSALKSANMHKDSKTVRRRIVAFFLIDPSARICSSSDVPSITERGASFQDACAHRLKLMEERSAEKGLYNKGWSYGLCEH